MTGPTEAHSSCFSCDSAGKEDEPGRVMPRASAALAMVLAVYICHHSKESLSVTDGEGRGEGKTFGIYVRHHMLRDLDRHAVQYCSVRFQLLGSFRLGDTSHRIGKRKRYPTEVHPRMNRHG